MLTVWHDCDFAERTLVIAACLVGLVGVILTITQGV